MTLQRPMIKSRNGLDFLVRNQSNLSLRIKGLLWKAETAICNLSMSFLVSLILWFGVVVLTLVGFLVIISSLDFMQCFDNWIGVCIIHHGGFLHRCISFIKIARNVTKLFCKTMLTKKGSTTKKTSIIPFDELKEVNGHMVGQRAHIGKEWDNHFNQCL